MTFEDASRLDPAEQAGELDAGVWIPVTRNTWRHGQIVGNSYSLLREYARRVPGWSVSVGDPGAKLAHDPDILRGPDVAIVRLERVPTGRGAAGWLEGAPDVAVEVIGESQAISGLAKKALEYLRAGAKMVWVLDPEPRRIMIFTLPNHIQILESDATLDAGEVLEGFRCPVSLFFE